jgi:hypothetical protein
MNTGFAFLLAILRLFSLLSGAVREPMTCALSDPTNEVPTSSIKLTGQVAGAFTSGRRDSIGVRLFGDLSSFALRASQAKDANSCPLCGCAAHHCEKGVLLHRICLNATAAERAAIRDRKERLRTALLRVPSSYEEDNRTVGKIASELGYRGLQKDNRDSPQTAGSWITADDMYWFLQTGAANSDGWEAILADDDVTGYANAGYLVVGVAHSPRLTKVYGRLPEDLAHGEVFVVLPGSVYDPEKDGSILRGDGCVEMAPHGIHSRSFMRQKDAGRTIFERQQTG